ncbi:MAG: tRNA dihydrouridine synthase, partial [Bellilinea sp.]
GHPDLARRVQYAEFERPIAFQIFDDDPVRIVDAAQMLLAYQPDIIDVNLGCSAKCVTNRGAGAALLRDPRKIGEIFSNLTRSLPVPVTGKIRLGWDDTSLNYLEVARTIQDNGGSLVSVHGRTRVQGYTGSARWEPIREIKQALIIPVVANGDISAVSDIDNVFQLTGCDAVMIGRAALENPWLFSRLDRAEVRADTVQELMVEHLQASLAYYGDDRGIVLFRKYAKRLLQPYELPTEQMKNLLTLIDPNEFMNGLNLIFQQVRLAQQN